MRYGVEELLGEQERIEALVSRLTKLVRPGPLNICAIRRVDETLTIVLDIHFTKLAELFSGQLRRRTERRAGAHRKPYALLFAELTDDLHDYLTGWPPKAILRNAAYFADETREIAARLRDCMCYEGGVLLPRALCGGKLQLRRPSDNPTEFRPHPER